MQFAIWPWAQKGGPQNCHPVGIECRPWHTNIQIQIKMDPSWTELAPLSALGHSNIKMVVWGSARTSPFICFGAHQYPNSNMSNVLTQYLTLVGTLLHNTFSDSTARGLRNRRVGGCSNKQWGKHSIRPTIVVFLQRGAGAKNKNFLRFFLQNPFLRRAQSQKLIFLLRFFLRKTTPWTGN